MITKRFARFVGATCVATGVVALSGLVASGAAVGAVVEGFKSAANVMKEVLTDKSQAEVAREESQTVAEKSQTITMESEM